MWCKPRPQQPPRGGDTPAPHATHREMATWLMFCPMPERDLYAWARTTYVSRRSRGFTPNVDVYYCGDPQRAVVKVDLAGVKLDEVGIEVSGRQIAIMGERHVQETEGRVYQQVEIESGPFRRVVELQVDVDAEKATANYEDGVLRIDLPLRDPTDTTRRVPIGRE
jgi:HSP20 family protein